jgi:hypothetical protein
MMWQQEADVPELSYQLTQKSKSCRPEACRGPSNISFIGWEDPTGGLAFSVNRR